MSGFRLALLASAFVAATASSAMAGDFDGAWSGQGLSGGGAKARSGTCAGNPPIELTVKNNVAQGKATMTAGNVKSFRWPVKPDGTVDTDDAKGKFDGKEFHGTWNMPTQASACNFSVTLSKKG
jgi:hypothetical protein